MSHNRKIIISNNKLYIEGRIIDLSPCTSEEMKVVKDYANLINKLNNPHGRGIKGTRALKKNQHRLMPLMDMDMMTARELEVRVNEIFRQEKFYRKAPGSS